MLAPRARFAFCLLSPAANAPGRPPLGRFVRYPTRRGASHAGGFSLVELLVVLAILGLVVALLLPAVQAAREAGRRNVCRNHLRQIGLAFLTHESAMRHFPTGGWSQRWVGDPDLGFGPRQPGGWEYNILPFIEEKPLHDLGAGKSEADKLRLFAERSQVSQPLYHCPSRRGPGVRPAQCSFHNAAPLTQNAKMDFSACAGSYVDLDQGPDRLAGSDQYPWPAASLFDGVTYMRSQTRREHIRDGLSRTLLVGEKYLNPEYYEDSQGWADDEGIYVGQQCDNTRWVGPGREARADTAGLDDDYSFGGPHANAWQAVFCDGSVHSLDYELDNDVLIGLGNRHDGQILARRSY